MFAVGKEKQHWAVMGLPKDQLGKYYISFFFFTPVQKIKPEFAKVKNKTATSLLN